jgi:hypothetical protein
MANAVAEYGRTLVMPTDEEFSPDIVSVKESVYPKWSVVIPLRTVEEGASDLSLQLIVSQTNSTEFELGISDLHVL